jgi:hypothetical protein
VRQLCAEIAREKDSQKVQELAFPPPRHHPGRPRRDSDQDGIPRQEVP